jgi:hypothetical protein
MRGTFGLHFLASNAFIGNIEPRIDLGLRNRTPLLR